MIRSTETRTSKMIHLTHTLKQTIINYTPDPTITSTFPAFIITLLCIGNICVNGHGAAADGAAGDWTASKQASKHKVCVGRMFVLFSTTSTVTKCRSGERLSVHPSFRIGNWTAAACSRQMVGPEFFKRGGNSSTQLSKIFPRLLRRHSGSQILRPETQMVLVWNEILSDDSSRH